MTDAAGGFYSTEDADSEGRGRQVLRLDAGRDRRGARRGGGRHVRPRVRRDRRGQLRGPQHPQPAQDARPMRHDPAAATRRSCRASLPLRGRSSSPSAKSACTPAKTTRCSSRWNGLMIDALARAGAALDEPRYAAAATKAADFIRQNLRRPDGRLLHTWRHGKAKLDAYLDDYACLANGLDLAVRSHLRRRRSSSRPRGCSTSCSTLRRHARRRLLLHGRRPRAADRPQQGRRPTPACPAPTPWRRRRWLRLGKLTGDRKYLDAAERTLERGGRPDAAGADGDGADALGARLSHRADVRDGARRRSGARFNAGGARARCGAGSCRIRCWRGPMDKAANRRLC